jgi:nucleotide-binding universal stress UspA family protein
MKDITMYIRILLATDGSSLSHKAEHSAIAMAAAFHAELSAHEQVVSDRQQRKHFPAFGHMR